MNKKLIRAQHFARLNRINQAMNAFEKVITSSSVSSFEKNSALHMLAYLHCMLAERDHEDDLLGADLRNVQQDHYLCAARYLTKITKNFDATLAGLPQIDEKVLDEVALAYQYQKQNFDLNEIPHRIKNYWFDPVLNLLKSSHKQILSSFR
jgi:hypothetical protein